MVFCKTFNQIGVSTIKAGEGIVVNAVHLIREVWDVNVNSLCDNEAGGNTCIKLFRDWYGDTNMMDATRSTYLKWAIRSFFINLFQEYLHNSTVGFDGIRNRTAGVDGRRAS